MIKRKGVILLSLLTLATSLSLPLAAQSGAIEPEAMAALNNMGKYLRSIKSFQVIAQTTGEDVLTNGEKVQHASTVNVLAHLPSQLRADINGDRHSRLVLYDGKSFTVHARRAGYYATAPAPGTIGELIDVALEKYDMDIPLVDLFLWGGPKAATSAITSATEIGDASVGGVTCGQYSFRQPGLDWQIWIQRGDFPLPRKLVLTTTTDEARPQHTAVYQWNLAPSFNADAFTFEAPNGVTKVVFAKPDGQNSGND